MRIKKIHINVDALKEWFKVFLTPGGLFSLLYFTRASGLGPTAPSGLLVLAALVILGFSFREKVELHLTSWSLWALIVWIPIGIIVSRPDPCFKSFQRFLFFLAIILVVSPAFTNRFLEKVRADAFEVFLKLAVVFSVASFFGYFVGINCYHDAWGREGEEFYQNTAGSFGGFFCHSMILGPIAAVAAVVLLSEFIKTRKFIYLIMVVCCMGSCAFSASRAALGGMLLAMLLTMKVLIKDKKQFRKVLAGSMVILVASFPLWIGALAMVQQKTETNLERGGMLASRLPKYFYRFEEVKKYPVFGVGFAAIDPEIGDDYQSGSGIIEPGSSWFCIPSMTGLVGLAFFVVFFIGCFRRLKIISDEIRPVLIGSLFFFSLHMLVEGYIFSIGSFLCFIVWLLTGVYSLKETKNA